MILYFFLFAAASKSWENGLFFKPQGESNILKEVCSYTITYDVIYIFIYVTHTQIETSVLFLTCELQERKKYLHAFPAVMCDSFAHFNMAFRMTKSGLLEVLFDRTLVIGPYEFIDIHNTWISKCNCTLFISSMKSSEDNFNISTIAAPRRGCFDTKLY